MEKALIAEIPSFTNPNKVYQVRRGADGVFYCTCPNWRFQKKSPIARKPCKHMRKAGRMVASGGSCECH